MKYVAHISKRDLLHKYKSVFCPVVTTAQKRERGRERERERGEGERREFSTFCYQETEKNI